MNVKQECLFLLLLFSLLTCGCGSSDESQAAEPRPTEPQAMQDQYVMGQTTKAEVVSQWGRPTGKSINEKQEEILTYNKSYMTGKQFIPFYFGGDIYRMQVYTFTFNKDGILTGMSSDEQHF